MPAGKFQVKLQGQWNDYGDEEDKLLKRAFLAGFPHARYSLRDQNYEYNFKQMTQKNTSTGKEREIRPPHKWSPPSKPLVEAGPTTTVRVAKGPGGKPPKTMCVPHPKRKGEFFVVNVPPGAKVGQVLLVPVPATGTPKGAGKGGASGGGGGATKEQEDYKKASGGKGVSGATAAAWGVGAAAVGVGAGVGGVILGEHIAEHGLDATVDAAGDGLADAGEAVADFAGDAADVAGDVAEDAGDWIVGAADDVGDFFMDLF